MTRFWTIALLISSILSLIVWDIIVAVNTVPGDTISEIVLAFSERQPFLPFAVGFVCGHLFWSNRKRQETWVPIVAGVVSFLGSLFVPNVIPVIPFLVGLPLGHFLWPQVRK